MLHTRAWFFDQIGKVILRGTTGVPVTVANYDKLFELQGNDYTFNEGPKAVIHFSDSVCESCSA